ncbi:MAG: hypothetical protein WCC72_10340, partial [Dehalococcoidales bacterium]
NMLSSASSQGVADLVRKGGLLCSERPAGLLRKGGSFTPKYAPQDFLSSLPFLSRSFYLLFINFSFSIFNDFVRYVLQKSFKERGWANPASFKVTFRVELRHLPNGHFSRFG